MAETQVHKGSRMDLNIFTFNSLHICDYGYLFQPYYCDILCISLHNQIELIFQPYTKHSLCYSIQQANINGCYYNSQLHSTMHQNQLSKNCNWFYDISKLWTEFLLQLQQWHYFFSLPNHRLHTHQMIHLFPRKLTGNIPTFVNRSP